MGGKYNGKNVVVTSAQYKLIEALDEGESVQITVHRMPKGSKCEVVTGGRKPIKCRITHSSGRRQRGVNEVTIQKR